jgi:tetratricopeptide (TPR) repeat protein
MDGAIVYLRAGLKGDASDLASLEMIAQCHLWAGRTDEAIATCGEALGYNLGSFDTHSMLAQLLAEKGEHEDAAVHVRKGLECYPEPLPEIPHFVASAIKGLSRIFPFLRAPDAALQQAEAERAAWFDWAKQYLSWYDLTYGETVKPKEH